MHTKRLPITPRNTIVDQKDIWNTVAPRGWWRYVGNPGAVDCVPLAFTADVLCVALLYTSFIVIYLQEKQCLPSWQNDFCILYLSPFQTTGNFFIIVVSRNLFRDYSGLTNRVLRTCFGRIHFFYIYFAANLCRKLNT